MNKNTRDKGPHRLPPSLSNIKTEFDKLFVDLGGPADIGVDINKRALAESCREYPSRQIVPILLPYQNDEGLVRRHWPWAAFAVHQYLFERKEREKYTDEPPPEKTVETLEKIITAARTLSSSLIQLENLSDRLTDPAAPDRRAHLGWLNAIISQAAAGRVSNEVNEDAEALLAVDLGKKAFIKILGEIIDAAELAEKAVDKNFLKRERSPTDPSLPEFVHRCGRIWKSLTKREPSANKVLREATDDLPDFVVFVQKLAEAGRAPSPSLKQVQNSLRKHRTPD